MDLPPEVLRSAMRTHQRYFGLLEEDSWLPRIASSWSRTLRPMTAERPSSPATSECCALASPMRASSGNWTSPRAWRSTWKALKGVVFHARLGSMHHKAKRLEELSRSLFIAIKDANRGWADNADPDDAARAGRLCKADLVTEMVGEFPDLQGVMGRYYALYGDEEPVVSDAIRDHYSPAGPSEPCPKAPVSVAVALADKLDTLVGFFAIDERPTGSKDPFALRRAALGVVRVIMEQEPPLRLPLGPAVDAALAGYADLLPEAPGPKATKDALLAFFADRFKVLLRGLGLHHGLVNAVFGATGEDDPNLLLERIRMR